MTLDHEIQAFIASELAKLTAALESKLVTLTAQRDAAADALKISKSVFQLIRDHPEHAYSSAGHGIEAIEEAIKKAQ